MTDKICKFCGLLITVPTYRLKSAKYSFCSRACNAKFYGQKKVKNLVHIKCFQCHRHLSRFPSTIYKETFCSKTCLYKYRELYLISIECKNCKKSTWKNPNHVQFKNRKYCSVACYFEFRTREKLNWLCLRCGIRIGDIPEKIKRRVRGMCGRCYGLMKDWRFDQELYETKQLWRKFIKEKNKTMTVWEQHKFRNEIKGETDGNKEYGRSQANASRVD